MSILTRLTSIEKRLADRKPKPAWAYVDPLAFARQSLGFHPDAWQENVLSWRGDRLLLNCCRQSGKSTTTAILALHRALFFPRSLTLLVSPTLRQSAELFKKVTDFLSLLPVRPELTEDNRLSLQMKNGSRVVSLPSKEANVRGYSGASLIIEDEAARVSDDLYLAMRPMLAVSGGKLILMSTPWGKRGHFHAAWENGGETWHRIKITAEDCPRISPAFLAEEQRTMPAPWFQSEYCGEFIDPENCVFPTDLILQAVSPDVHPLFPDLVRPTPADTKISPLFENLL
ncbi:MAG: terminase large subunit [Candidatus Binatia bacterium]